MAQAFCEFGDELRFHGCHILPCSIIFMMFIMADKTLRGGIDNIIHRFDKTAQGRINRIFFADSIIEIDLHAKCGSLSDCVNDDTAFSFKYYDNNNNRYFTKRKQECSWGNDGRKDYKSIVFYSMLNGKPVETVSYEAMTSKEWIISKPRNPLSKSDERIINDVLSMPAIKGTRTCWIRSETNCSDREVIISGIDKTGRHETFEITIKNLKADGPFAAFPDRSIYKYGIVDGKIGQLDYSCVKYEYGTGE